MSLDYPYFNDFNENFGKFATYLSKQWVWGFDLRVMQQLISKKEKRLFGIFRKTLQKISQNQRKDVLILSANINVKYTLV